MFVWSDEKFFTVEPKLNSQNDRILAESASNIDPPSRIIQKSLKPEGIMVWAAVVSDGSKGPLVFIDQGLKVNADVYVQLLHQHVLPWPTESFPDGFVFMHGTVRLLTPPESRNSGVRPTCLGSGTRICGRPQAQT